MKHREVTLEAAARRVVHDVIVKHCDIRDWSLHAVNVRSNHVHVVLSCPAGSTEAMRQLKEWSTRELRRHGLATNDARVWTERGSRKNLWNGESLRRAVEYVMEHQGGDLE